MFLNTLVHIAVLFLSFLYPVYRSIRIYRKKEEPQNKNKVLKYWIEVYDAVLALIYVILLVENFRFSEYVYDNLIEDLINSQETKIDKFVKKTGEYIEENTKDWMIAIKDFTLKTVNNAIIPMAMDMIRNAIYGQRNLNIPPVVDESVQINQVPSKNEKVGTEFDSNQQLSSNNATDDAVQVEELDKSILSVHDQD
eukprot:403352240